MKISKRESLGLSLVFGAAAAAASWHGLAQLNALDHENQADILVFASDVESFGFVTAEKVRWRKWPDAAITPGMITRKENPAIDRLAARAAPYAYAAGDPVPRVLLGGDQAGVSAPRPGLRSITVRVKDETSLALLHAGAVVDVMPTRLRTGASSHAASMQDIRVLAVQTEQAAGGISRKQGAKSAILEVTPQQARALAPYAAAGDVQFALVNAEAEPAAAPAGAFHMRGAITLIKNGVRENAVKPQHRLE